MTSIRESEQELPEELNLQLDTSQPIVCFPIFASIDKSASFLVFGLSMPAARAAIR